MPNDYFQFKQFLIKQDKCAMKVCTDACVFGSSLSPAPSGEGRDVRALDIGTGTGLLALMFAQKSLHAIIDAVEIDEAAAQQAKENFDNSPWKERLKVYHTSIQQFINSTIHHFKYDVIICNPPFFENDLKSENEKRNLALHSDALSLEELISVVDILLKDDGNFFCLLPFHRTKYFEELLLKYKLCVKEKAFIKQTPKHNYFRTIFCMNRLATAFTESEIIIMDEKNEYTKEFREKLCDYYLRL
jgi:tRNA1Val (adenine37-N6)-methyltransferase